MAGKTQTKLASGSPQTFLLVISTYFPVRCEMKIAIIVLHFVVHSDYGDAELLATSDVFRKHDIR